MNIVGTFQWAHIVGGRDERTKTVECCFGPNFGKSLVCSKTETFLVCGG